MSAAAAPSRGIIGLLKKGWNEIPEVMASSVMGLLGVGIAIFALNKYYADDGDNRRYKERYTVYRHDDPRVERIRKD